MENEWGFNLGDDFEESRRKVAKALDDPKFVEILNSTLVIQSVADGQRPYSLRDLTSIKGLELEMQDEEKVFKPGTFRTEFADKLGLATANLTRDGKAHFEGNGVYELVDDILFITFEHGRDLQNVSEDVEIALAAIIYSRFGKPFDSYQLDIELNGQGLMAETYDMTVHFRPAPKNVAPPGAIRISFPR